MATIKIKYGIGDEVWAYLDKQHRKGKIFSITIDINEDGRIDEYYYIMFGDDDVCLLGECLFSTKEELLKSL